MSTYDPLIECNLIISYQYIKAGAFNFWNNLNALTKSAFLCEYGGLEDPYIASVRTVGQSDAVINKIVNMTLLSRVESDIAITFTNVDDGRMFSGSNINITSDSSLTASIPPGSGRYNVSITVTDVTATNGHHTLNTTFHYKPAQVNIIIAGFTSGSRISLVGDNFVVDNNKTSIYFSSTLVPCVNVTLPQPGVLACTLTQDLTTSLAVPITINTDSVYSIVNRPLFYDSGSGNYYSCVRVYNTRQGCFDFARKQTVQGRMAFLSYINNSIAKQVVSSMCPNTLSQWSFDTNSMYTQDISFNTGLMEIGGGGLTRVIDGPATGTDVTLTLPITGTGSSNLTYNPSQGYQRTLSPAPLVDDGTFTQLVYPTNLNLFAPNTPTSISMSTNGSKAISIPLAKVGTPLDSTYFTFMGKPLPSPPRDYYSDDIQIDIPAGYGTQSLVYTFQQFGGAALPVTKSITIQYDPPTINNMTSVGADGGVVTLIGTNLYTNSSLLKVTLGSNQCNNVQIVEPHKSITCRLEAPVFGDLQAGLEAKVYLDGTQSLPFKYDFLSPVVLVASPGEQDKATMITITGDNFPPPPANISVVIGGAPCAGTTYISNNTIQCMFDGMVPMPANSVETLPVNVSAQGLFGVNRVFFYTNKTQLNCSGNGTPFEGRCICNDGWTLHQCSVRASPSPASPEINGASIISPGDNRLSFKTSIAFIREIDNKGAPIRTLNMSSITWKDVTNSTDPTSSTHLMGTFPNIDNETVVVDMLITHYLHETDILFTGETMHIAANSIKVTVAVRSWRFKDMLSNLQLVFESKTAKEKGPCIQTKSSSAFNSFYVELDRSVLYASFAGHLFVDGRVVTSIFQDIVAGDPLYGEASTSTTEFTYRSTITIPHFDKECIVDPNFQSLLKVDGEPDSAATSCIKPAEKKSYTIIIIIVVCCVAGVGIIIGAILLIKKYKYRLLVRAPSGLINLGKVRKGTKIEFIELTDDGFMLGKLDNGTIGLFPSVFSNNMDIPTPLSTSSSSTHHQQIHGSGGMLNDEASSYSSVNSSNNLAGSFGIGTPPAGSSLPSSYTAMLRERLKLSEDGKLSGSSDSLIESATMSSEMPSEETLSPTDKTPPTSPDKDAHGDGEPQKAIGLHYKSKREAEKEAIASHFIIVGPQPVKEQKMRYANRKKCPTLVISRFRDLPKEIISDLKKEDVPLRDIESNIKIFLTILKFLTRQRITYVCPNSMPVVAPLDEGTAISTTTTTTTTSTTIALADSSLSIGSMPMTTPLAASKIIEIQTSSIEVDKSLVENITDQVELKKRLMELKLQRKRALTGVTPEFLAQASLSIKVFPDIKKKVKIGNIIGKGGYGKVFEAHYEKKKVAIKVVHYRTPKEQHNVLIEIGFLQRCKHPNILEYKASVLHENKLLIVTEFLPGGTLEQAVASSHVFKDTHIGYIGKEILKGIAYLHENKIVHRDVKSANVMLSTTGDIKLIDFGLCASVEKGTSNHIVGSPYWMSPEMIKGDPHSYPADIWGFGVLLLEMLFKRPPHRESRLKAMFMTATVGIDVTKLKCSLDLKDLLWQCFEMDPNKRSSATKLLRHPFFQRADTKQGIKGLFDNLFLQRNLNTTGIFQ
ncbi:hypothetical protein SAMD00019534_021070 [Acytostelium subglobosum LB1]|uniref:hypothetical protein n=1 Tax=Acytostelium subglobosum LB1 TaxID=1410327 RepID=UPI0006447CBD|nr:hypothetical protein SAMD00019534_021070 [Acytostelium subglobosum LB1]GAM18932.1 hypothetical protein SAMD00019534_021070 [Acytostelium subglobosum LB1]|eukprot:XP_012758152.1 hypothetical protein SAMD00019534_021070 [Acytostelium subglobosum LB1]